VIAASTRCARRSRAPCLRVPRPGLRSALAWFRTILASCSRHDRLSYLDVDMLVAHGLEALWTTPLDEGHLFGAVTQPSYALERRIFSASASAERPVLQFRRDADGTWRLCAPRLRCASPHARDSPDPPLFRSSDQCAMNMLFPGSLSCRSTRVERAELNSPAVRVRRGMGGRHPSRHPLARTGRAVAGPSCISRARWCSSLGTPGASTRSPTCTDHAGDDPLAARRAGETRRRQGARQAVAAGPDEIWSIKQRVGRTPEI